MSAQSKLVWRMSVIPSPGRIFIGYVLVLLTATAGVVVFPFSSISMGMFFATVAAFYLMTTLILMKVYLFRLVAGYRASIKFGRRLIFVQVTPQSPRERVNRPSARNSWTPKERTWISGIDGLMGLAEWLPHRHPRLMIYAISTPVL